MSDSQMILTAETDRGLIDAAGGSERFLEVTITAPRQESVVERPAVNTALILDRSGSMAGEKLEFAKRAAIHVLDTLTERDRVAIVIYDDEISVLSRSEPVTASNREKMKREIRNLGAGNSTNLGGGWLRGAQEVADNLQESGVNRALLLTDGLANVGIVDPQELAKHASELRQRRVSTSTFGIGLGFNEYLLESMAEHGGGKFYYIDSPDRIPSIFGEELGELLSVTAREVMLRVFAPASVKLELLGSLPHEKRDECLSIPIGDLCSGERQTLYLKVLTPPGSFGDRIEFRMEASYAGTDNAARVERSKAVLTYSSASEVESAPRNRDVEQGAAEVDFALARQQAIVMERAGDYAGAVRHITLRSHIHAAYAPAASIKEMEDFAEELKSGLTEVSRKQTHSKAYSQKRGRS